MGRLSRFDQSSLAVCDREGCYQFGPSNDELLGEIVVRDSRFYRFVALGGAIGAAEAYIRGYWDTEDLVATMRVMARNLNAVAHGERGLARLMRPLRQTWHALRPNSRKGSRRNISEHYDLSNEFFALMLDSTMTYSAGFFASPESTLREASTEKYDRICRKLRLEPTDRVIEIGTGWGGFAEHAVKNYGCHVATTTISLQQHDFARTRFQQEGTDNRIELLKIDYRDLTGQFDKLVSIEMIEAVGEQYLPTYFEKCSSLLKPGGVMALQAITIPDDRYDDYRRSVDFIQRYIFPGGFLPSPSAIETLARKNDLRIDNEERMTSHYAKTLEHWSRNFEHEIDAVKSLGFDERFIRTWRYYLAYCEAGFRERRIDVSQILLTKAANGRYG